MRSYWLCFHLPIPNLWVSRVFALVFSWNRQHSSNLQFGKFICGLNDFLKSCRRLACVFFKLTWIYDDSVSLFLCQEKNPLYMGHILGGENGKYLPPIVLSDIQRLMPPASPSNLLNCVHICLARQQVNEFLHLLISGKIYILKGFACTLWSIFRVFPFMFA